MNLFSKIFKSNKIECPRCLGKGHVDLNDIKRLKKEIQWKSGKCAYCNGKGKVNSKILSKVPFDNIYLGNNLPKEERNRIFNNDSGAIKRGIEYENNIEIITQQVNFLFEFGLDKNDIFKFYKIQLLKSKLSEKEIMEFGEFIEKIISLNKN